MVTDLAGGRYHGTALSENRDVGFYRLFGHFQRMVLIVSGGETTGEVRYFNTPC